MPVIADKIGELPTGKVIPASMDQVSKYLRDNYLNSSWEDKRIKTAKDRLDLYHDRGERLITDMVNGLFKDPTVRSLRREFIRYAMFQNVTRRVVNEISTVYSEAAKRSTLDGNEGYQEVIQGISLDQVMRKVNQYVNLLNECLVYFRVRNGETKAHVVTPDSFYAVSHPLDPTELIAVIVSSRSKGVDPGPTDPIWQVWTAGEMFFLNEMGNIVSGTFQEHNLGRIPAVLVHREVPDTMLLNPDPGGDLVSAQMAIALLNVMMMKEQKSGSKVPYIVGDIGNTATGQSMDTEHLTQFEEGVSPGTLDLGANPQNYISSSRSVIKQVAANYGIPESIIDHSPTGSGFEIEMRRISLREKRRDQIINPFRPAEMEIAEILSGLTGKFSTDGWSIDFGEVQTPQEPLQKLAFLREARRMGLTNTVEIMQGLNPEFDEERAAMELEKNIDMETARVERMREMNSMQGGVDTSMDESDPVSGENG